MKRRTILALTLSLCAVLSTACTAVTSQEMPFPDQTVELENPGWARIYVTRDEQTIGLIRSIEVIDNSKPVGLVAQDGYLCWERSPGRTQVQLIYEGLRLDQGDVETLLDVECAAGEVHYYLVRLEIDTRKPYAERVDAEEGRRIVALRQAPGSE